MIKIVCSFSIFQFSWWCCAESKTEPSYKDTDAIYYLSFLAAIATQMTHVAWQFVDSSVDNDFMGKIFIDSERVGVLTDLNTASTVLLLSYCLSCCRKKWHRPLTSSIFKWIKVWIDNLIDMKIGTFTGRRLPTVYTKFNIPVFASPLFFQNTVVDDNQRYFKNGYAQSKFNVCINKILLCLGDERKYKCVARDKKQKKQR